MKKILFASNNKHKCMEMKELFKLYSANVELIFPFELSSEKFEPIENGTDYQENALIKAKSFYEKYGIECFSDDSGLECVAIDGKPGINSARYSGENANDKSNRVKLLNELSNKSDSSARFYCCICFFDGINQQYFDGFVEGSITETESGINGFGYDPIFIPKNYSITFAEMSDEEKNQISHRSVAVSKFVKYLNQIENND